MAILYKAQTKAKTAKSTGSAWLAGFAQRWKQRCFGNKRQFCGQTREVYKISDVKSLKDAQSFI